MPRLKHPQRNLIAAAILGVTALTINFVSYSFWPTLLPPIGNILLFCSAATLGALGVLVSVLTGVVPEVAFSGDFLYGVHMLVVLLAVSYTARRHPQTPSYVPVLGAWVTILAPALLTLHAFGVSPSSLSHQSLVALGDLILAMVSGSLLLIPALWNLLSIRPRQVTLAMVLGHILPSLASVAICGAALVGSHQGAISSLSGLNLTVTSVTLLLVLVVFLPSSLALFVARHIGTLCQKIVPEGLMPQISKASGFSGRSSEYWRRQSSSDLSVARTSLGSSSGTNFYRSVTGGDQLWPEQGICALNRNGTITFLNRKFSALAEIKATEVLGKKIDDVCMHPEICKHIIELIDRTFEAGPRTTELKINQIPNKLRFFEIASMKSDALENSVMSDGPDSVIILVKEITERRTVESHLLQAQKLESLGTLVGGIAHAFNNALTTIVGQTSIAKITKSQAQVSASLNAIQESAQNAGTLVRQLLDFAEGRPTLVNHLDLGTVIEERLVLLRKLAGETIEFTFERPASPTPVNADPNLLMQVLTNLVLNARDSYGDHTGRITVTLETEEMDADVSDVHIGARPGKFARVRVKDHGAGMSRDTLARAFDPLFTTKASTGHTGLGLSIVFTIVRAHDGFLSVESRPEKGTTVSVYLPLSQEEARSTALETQARAQHSQQPEEQRRAPSPESNKILVVEDEKSVRELVTTMLSSMGYQVASCSNGPEALEQCKSSQFDLVLIDMIMPQMHGLDLVARLRELNGAVRTLIMTGYGVTTSPESSADFIPKPFDMETLKRAVEEALAKTPGERRDSSSYLM